MAIQLHYAFTCSLNFFLKKTGLSEIKIFFFGSSGNIGQDKVSLPLVLFETNFIWSLFILFGVSDVKE